MPSPEVNVSSRGLFIFEGLMQAKEKKVEMLVDRPSGVPYTARGSLCLQFLTDRPIIASHANRSGDGSGQT